MIETIMFFLTNFSLEIHWISCLITVNHKRLLSSLNKMSLLMIDLRKIFLMLLDLVVSILLLLFNKLGRVRNMGRKLLI